MVGGIRTGGFAALLVVFAVVLSAAAVPMMSGHTPLEAAGPDSAPEIGGVDGEPGDFDDVDDPQDVDSLADAEAGDGVIHEDFEAVAGEEFTGQMAEIAGLLALLFGADGLDGAMGEQSAAQEDDQDADSDDTESATDDSDDEQAGEDEQSDNDLAGSEADSDDGTDDESTDDDGAADSETDAGGEDTASLLDRLNPLTIGLLVGGLVAAAVGWFAYRTGRSLLGIVLSIPSLLFGAVTRFVFGITAVVERATRAIHAASSVFALPGLFVAAVIQSCRDLGTSARSLFDRGQPTVDAGGVDQLPSEREQIRAAWRSVIDAVDDRRYRRRTPGEIKRKAVALGLPEPPVATLVGVFRDVEYGAKDPTDRASSAVSAATELSEAAEQAETADSTDETPTTQTDGESTDADREGTR